MDKDQNSSDFQKAMKYLESQNLLPTIILGISGGYIDHILNNINNNVTNSPYTAHLKPAFISLGSLKNNITKITSSHVTLD